VARDGAGPWIAVAGLSALALGGAMLVIKGIDRAGIEAAVLWTGRLAFGFFWPSYAGGALAVLFGSRFEPLRRRGRALGLAFAAVVAVHLSLVAWLCSIGDGPPILTFVVFGIAAAWVAGLAASSIERVSREIGPAGWWVLRNIGMNYIAFVFAFDFLRLQPTAAWIRIAEYLPFASLSVLGPVLKLLAWLLPLQNRIGARPLDASFD